MKLVHRAFALIGTVAVASTVAACGGGAPEVDADDNDQPQTTDNSADADENDQAQTDPIDGGTVSIGTLDTDNIVGLCEQLFGSVEDLYRKISPDIGAAVTGSYGEWVESYDEQVGSIPTTFGCHASGGEDAEADEEVAIHVSDGMGEPSRASHVIERSDDVTAGIALQSDERPEDEVLAQFLRDEVLPKFKP